MQNKHLTIDHLNLTVNNLKESINWYGQVFHFKPVEKGTYPQGHPWVILKNGDQMLSLSERSLKSIDNSKTHHSILHFGIRLKNQQEWEKTVKQEKVNVEQIFEYPNSKSWYVFDPTGYEIEVSIWHNDQLKF